MAETGKKGSGCQGDYYLGPWLSGTLFSSWQGDAGVKITKKLISLRIRNLSYDDLNLVLEQLVHACRQALANLKFIFSSHLLLDTATAVIRCGFAKCCRWFYSRVSLICASSTWQKRISCKFIPKPRQLIMMRQCRDHKKQDWIASILIRDRWGCISWEGGEREDREIAVFGGEREKERSVLYKYAQLPKIDISS